MSERVEFPKPEKEETNTKVANEGRQDHLKALPTHRFSYWFPTLLCRVWVTINILITAAIWTAEWWAFWAWVGIGAAVDVARLYTSTDLRLDVGEIVARAQKEQEDVRSGQTKWQRDYFLWRICLLPFVYVGSLLIFEALAPNQLASFLGYLSPITELLSPFYSGFEHYSAQLIEAGYANRIPITLHVHAFGFLFVFAVLLLVFHHRILGFMCRFEAYFAKPEVVARRKGEDAIKQMKKMKGVRWVVVGYFPIIAMLLVLYADRTVKVIERQYLFSYSIHDNSYYYLFDAFFISVILMAMVGAYSVIFRLRMMGLGVWHLTKDGPVITREFRGEAL